MFDTTLSHATGNDTTTEIETEIRKIIDARAARSGAYGVHFLELCDLAAAQLNGGKLLRPRLLMGAFDALTTERTVTTDTRSVALEIAAAVEILHFAFLLHDDIIDEDLLRRGRPNLVGHLAGRTSSAKQATMEQAISDARRLHWARSSGLLVGDLMLTIAHQAFARARVSEEHRLRLLDLLDATVTETMAGEYCDVGLADGCITPDLELVLNMTRMKTAAYTFELPLRVASIICGSDHRLEQQLGSVGRHLGLAFQLQDDLLSAFGQSETHGKEPYSDFREGKETALIAYARMTHAWPSIEQLIGAEEFSEESGRRIQNLLIECGAKQFVESMVQDQTRAALSMLSAHDGVVPTTVSQFLLTFVDDLDGRRA